MKRLGRKGIKPNVVGDQIGRLTLEDLAKAIDTLIDSAAPFGTYNITNDGEPTNWADIAKKTFELTGHNPDDVTPVTESTLPKQIAEGRGYRPSTFTKHFKYC